MSDELQGRTVSESKSEYSELAMPNDANPHGNLMGGRVMHVVDLAAAIAAMRHARMPVVTASVDYLNFLTPIHIGELVIIKSSVNRVFRTSMEVGVKVFVEKMRTGELRHTCSAYLTFVAIDQAGNRVPVPPVIPETDEEQRRFDQAGERRKYRLELRARQRPDQATS